MGSNEDTLVRSIGDAKLVSGVNVVPIGASSDSPFKLTVRGNWGDRGRGPERLNDPDYDRGQRVAIRDWSHEHNHRLALEQSRIRTEERTREVHEYGLSY